jgi:hypothetical protein
LNVFDDRGCYAMPPSREIDFRAPRLDPLRSALAKLNPAAAAALRRALALAAKRTDP